MPWLMRAGAVLPKGSLGEENNERSQCNEFESYTLVIQHAAEMGREIVVAVSSTSTQHAAIGTVAF